MKKTKEHADQNMFQSNTLKYILVVVTVVLIAIDQVIKFWVEKLLPKHETLPIIDSVLHLTYVRNYGAAFGFFQNQKVFLLLITSLILIGAIMFMLLNKVDNSVFLWSLTLVISGGVGNLIDRIISGYVTDYIDFRLINFAVFNLADSYVVIGVTIMAIYILFIEPKQNRCSSEKLEIS